MRVIKHDRSQHHGVGIVPNIQVHKTINDVRNGHDAFVEMAKKCLN